MANQYLNDFSAVENEKTDTFEHFKPIDSEALLTPAKTPICRPEILITMFSIAFAFSFAFMILCIYYLIYAGVHHQPASSLASGWVTSVWAFMSSKWSFGFGFTVYHHFRKTLTA